MIRLSVLLAFHTLARGWRQSLALVMMLGVAILLALMSTGYAHGLDQEFRTTAPGYLIVQEPGYIGEVGGSRLPASLEDTLRALGVQEVIPQIYKATGVKIEDVIQVRGVSLDDYQKLLDVEVISGEALGKDTLPRHAMIGWRLAERLRAKPGSTIALRGRDFQVTGVFRTHTYADNEAWISLKDAQALLGYGQDVSVFYIEENGPLQPGDLVGGIAEVVPRGDAIAVLTGHVRPLLEYLYSVSQVSLVACMFTLVVILLRLAWLYRRELAILNCLGYPRHTFGLYLITQSTVVVTVGTLTGAFGCWLTAGWANLQASGFAIPLLLSPASLRGIGLWLVLITLAGALIPAAWLYQVPPDEVLRTE